MPPCAPEMTPWPVSGTTAPMNDDDPRLLLELLKTEHRRLDDEITELREAGAVDQLEIARLKKRKLLLKDEIRVLHDRLVPDITA
jgi:hypothetical protein